MGETKWNKKENMTNMKSSKVKKRKEKFKNMEGFIQLPPLVDVKEGFEDACGNDVEDASNVSMSLDDLAVSIEQSLDDYNESTEQEDLADTQWQEKLQQANLSDDLLYILQNTSAWTDIENTDNDGDDDEFCDQPAPTEAYAEFSNSLKHVRLVLKNVAIIIHNLPKLILLSFDFFNYIIKKIVANYCKAIAVINGENTNISDDDLNIVFGEVDKILYIFLVFIVSYNWFFIIFYYDRTVTGEGDITYDYVSSSYFINNEYIKPWMKQEPDSTGDWVMKHIFSSTLFVISFFSFIFTEHSVKTSLTVPNLLQRIISLNGFVPSLGTDLFDSLPVKWIFTIFLVYYGMPQMLNMMKYLVNMTPPMDPVTNVSAKGLYSLILVVAGMGFFAWPIGTSMYWVLKEFMAPNENQKEEDSDDKANGKFEKISKTIMKGFNIMKDTMTENSFLTMAKIVFKTIFTLFVRVSSILVLLPYTNAIIFMILAMLSLGGLFMFGSTFLDNINKVNSSILESITSCFSLRQKMSKFATYINKVLLSILLLLTCIYSINSYGSWPQDSDNKAVRNNLLIGLYIIIAFIGASLSGIPIFEYFLKYILGSFTSNYDDY